MPRPLLFAEDRLLEALGLRILAHAGVEPLSSKIMGGRAAVERRLRAWNTASFSVPILAIIDRDRRGPCCGAEVERLVPGRGACMLLRLAVEAADAWVLADKEGFARFLGVSSGKVPNTPESLPDPKLALVNLARRARSRDRRRIAPEPGTTARVGPGYNAQLCSFVAREWSIEAAMLRASSLARCVRAVQRLPTA